MKKLICLILCALTVLSTVGCSKADTPSNKPAKEPTMTAGTYTATVNGHNAPMTIEVTVSDKAI